MLDKVSLLPWETKQRILPYMNSRSIKLMILYDDSWLQLLIANHNNGTKRQSHSSLTKHSFVFIFHLSNRIATKLYQQLNLQERIRLTSHILQDPECHTIAQYLAHVEINEDKKYTNPNNRIFERHLAWRFRMLNCPITRPFSLDDEPDMQNE